MAPPGSYYHLSYDVGALSGFSQSGEPPDHTLFVQHQVALSPSFSVWRAIEQVEQVQSKL